AFGADARARCVAVANRHGTVDLRDGETPLAELAQRATVAAVAREVVQSVLVLREDEKLHPWVAEDLLLVQDLAKFLELRLDLALLQGARLVDELVEALDFVPKRHRVDDEHRLF